MKPRDCVCGARYDDMRTGMTFRSVRLLLWDIPDKNRPGWFIQKTRANILGKWHEIKRDMWFNDHGNCHVFFKPARKRRKSPRLRRFFLEPSLPHK